MLFGTRSALVSGDFGYTAVIPALLDRAPESGTRWERASGYSTRGDQTLWLAGARFWGTGPGTPIHLCGIREE